MLCSNLMCQVIIWPCDCVMHFQSKTHISPLLTIESPVTQWLEHLARSHRVVGSNPIWNSDLFFFEFSVDAIFCYAIYVTINVICYFLTNG